MQILMRNWRRWGVVLAVVLALVASPAMAQEYDPYEDDSPYFDVPVMPLKKPYLPWLTAALLAAGCLFIAFKNPHRSHLD